MKKDFAKIPTDLNYMYIGTELIEILAKIGEFFFAVLKGLKVLQSLPALL